MIGCHKGGGIALLRRFSSQPRDWKSSGGTSRKFGGVRAEVSGRGPGLLRSYLGVEISRRKPSEANF